MKTTYFSLIFSLITALSFSQIGINTTTPDESSILDISATNRGVLFPRVALSGAGDNTTITNPAESLLVYNTANTADLSPGFYFWTGSTWNSVSGNSSGSGGSNEKWSLEGNSVDNTKFLGTTNYSSLKFKVNNDQFVLFDPHGGMALGYGAVANENNAVAIGTNANASQSNQATAVGPSSVASGFQSAALGYNARAITSNSTLALGNSSTASSFQATAIGVNSKATTNNNTLAIGTNSEATGENSTALGTASKASGQYAVALGTNAYASGQNSSAIGNNANASAQNTLAIGDGSIANNPNTLILGNNLAVSSWSATKVGIGTSNPSEKLEVKGNIKVEGDIKIQSGTINIADGSQGAGKVLTSDANGNATWASYPQLSDSAFADVYASNSQSLTPWAPITFGNTTISDNVNVNSNNLQIITGGIYRVTYAVSIRKSGGGDTNVKFQLAKGWNSNFVPGSASYVFVGNGDEATATVTKLIHFNAYEQLYVFTDASSSSNITSIANGTHLTIELVKAD
tara:strand:- start:85780 stop:87330 length:1551 start_codon:yes stop_codon:yes gene_type:complete